MAASGSAAARAALTLTVVLLSGAVVNGAVPSKPVLEGTARIVDGDTLYIGGCMHFLQQQVQAPLCCGAPGPSAQQPGTQLQRVQPRKYEV